MYYLTVEEPTRWKSKRRQGWFLLEGESVPSSSPSFRWASAILGAPQLEDASPPPPSRSSHGLLCVCTWPSVSLAVTGLIQYDLILTNYICKDLISQEGHILRCQVDIDLGGHYSAQSTQQHPNWAARFGAALWDAWTSQVNGSIASSSCEKGTVTVSAS